MGRNLIGCILITTFLFSTLAPSVISTDDSPWWNHEWSFREEISIPINTAIGHAKFQPIDIIFTFKNPCWAINETRHSIRVIYQDGGRFIHLESQIYNLNFTDENYIDECNLVFLIPEEANGNEKYFVYYDDSQKGGPNYQDHVSIENSYYRYEPVYGIVFETWFYKITEEENIVYGIAQKGHAMELPIAQRITKLKPNSKELVPNNGEHIAGLHFQYWWYANDVWQTTSSAEKLVHKEIFIDGNLMVKCAVVSESEDGLIRSTVYYKYYYSPSENKRIYANVKHEALDKKLPTGTDIDAAFAIVNSGGIKSSSIEELNFGSIPPYLHFYSDKERIVTYQVDTHPEGSTWQETVSREDDADLGSFAWMSIDHGTSGNAQGIIFDDNNFLKGDFDEPTGAEIHVFQANIAQFPGLTGRLADYYIMRDSYEPDQEPDLEMPTDYVAEFAVDIFSTEDGGYKLVEEEARMFHSLVAFQPQNEEEFENGNGDIDEYNLTVYVRLNPSLFMKYSLGKLFLKNTFVAATITHDNEYLAWGRVGMVPLTEELMIDWSNISLLKKIRFTSLPEGNYVVKILLGNTLLSDRHQFVGYHIFELKEDEVLTINCINEGFMNIDFVDQNDNGVEGAEVVVYDDETVLSKIESDSNGSSVVGLPTGLGKKYAMKIFYQGFLIKDEEVDFNLFRRLSPLQKSFMIRNHDLTIKILDDDGKSPDFNMKLILNSPNMVDLTDIEPDSASDGEYIFSNLLPTDYNLNLRYDQFDIKIPINISKDENLELKLYNLTASILDTWNLTPGTSLDVILTSNDFEEPVVFTGRKIIENGYEFTNLYPGNYTLNVGYKSFIFTEDVEIIDEEHNKITISFPAIFNVTTEILDSHGSPVQNAKITISRKQKNHTFTTDSAGISLFKIPPGEYDATIFLQEELVGKRKISILNDKSFSIVTEKEPITPYAVIAIVLIGIIGLGIYCARKKNTVLMVKMLIVLLIILSLVVPWWSLHNDSGSDYETNTDLFLLPAKIISLSDTGEVIAGEEGTLNEDFLMVIEIITISLLINILLIFISIILLKKGFRRLSFLCLTFVTLFLLLSSIAFYIAMDTFSDALVGPLTGSGALEISIPGELEYQTINCNWGFNLGFYVILISSIIMILTLSYLIIRGVIKRNKTCL